MDTSYLLDTALNIPLGSSLSGALAYCAEAVWVLGQGWVRVTGFSALWQFKSGAFVPLAPVQPIVVHYPGAACSTIAIFIIMHVPFLHHTLRVYRIPR